MAVTGEGLELAIAGVAASRAAAERAGQQAALMARLTQALAELRGHEEHPGRARAAGRRGWPPARQAEPVRPLLAALAEADAAAGAGPRRAAQPDPPDPARTSLARPRRGRRRAERAEASGHASAAGLQHLADGRAACPRQEAELAAPGARQPGRRRPGRGPGGGARRSCRPGSPRWRRELDRGAAPRPAGWTRPVPALDEITVQREAAVPRRPSLRRRWTGGAFGHAGGRGRPPGAGGRPSGRRRWRLGWPAWPPSWPPS